MRTEASGQERYYHVFVFLASSRIVSHLLLENDVCCSYDPFLSIVDSVITSFPVQAFLSTAGKRIQAGNFQGEKRGQDTEFLVEFPATIPVSIS